MGGQSRNWHPRPTFQFKIGYYYYAIQMENFTVGLDMWLYAAKSISSSRSNDEQFMNEIVKFMDVGDLYDPNSFTSSKGKVELLVAYWCKHHKLHMLFCEACNKDPEEGHYIHLEPENLQKVFELCKTNGYDETSQKLKKILSLHHIHYFVYRASW